jgi:hypothetical protein
MTFKEEIILDKEKAIQTLIGIYNALQTIPAYDDKSTLTKAGMFQALQELTQWLNEFTESGEKADVK